MGIEIRVNYKAYVVANTNETGHLNKFKSLTDFHRFS